MKCESCLTGRLSALAVPLLTFGLLAAGCSQPKSRIYRYETPVDASAKADDVDLLGSEESFNAGWSDVRAGRMDAALRDFERAIRQDPANGRAYNNAGWVYYKKGQTAKAGWSFRRAIELLPGEAEPLSNLGLVMEDAGRLDEAVRLHDAAAKAEPENPLYVARSAKARLERGDAWETVNETVEQIAWSARDADWVAWAERQMVAHADDGSSDGVAE